MAATLRFASRAQQIYSWIESTSSADWLHGCDWIHRSLGQIVLGLGEQELRFAQAAGNAGSRFGCVVVVTDLAFAVSSLSSDDGPLSSPTTTIVPRRNLRSIAISGAEDVIYEPDNFGNRAVVQRWPGEVSLELSVEGIAAPVLLRGPGVDPNAVKKDGHILRLLYALRDELIGVAPDSTTNQPPPYRVR